MVVLSFIDKLLEIELDNSIILLSHSNEIIIYDFRRVPRKLLITL